MKNYIMSLVAVSMCGAIASCLIASENTAGMKKLFNMLLSLVLIATLVSPITDSLKTILQGELDYEKIAEKIPSLSNAETEYNYNAKWQETFKKISSEQAEQIICRQIEKNYDLSPENFTAKAYISQSDDKFILEEITITLYGVGLLKNPRIIESEIGKLFDCKCTVY